MFRLQATILQTLGLQLQRNRKDQQFRHIFKRIASSPLLFMQIWCIPPIIHHIFFKWLVKIGPILYFIAGIVFTLTIEIYGLLVLLNVPSVKTMHNRRFYTTDEDVKVGILSKRRSTQLSLLQRQIRRSKSAKFLKNNGDIRMSEIEADEIDPLTQEYKHNIHYPDPRDDKEFFLSPRFSPPSNSFFNKEKKLI